MSSNAIALERIEHNQGVDIPEILKTEDLHVELMPEHLRYSLRIKRADIGAIGALWGVNIPENIGATLLEDNSRFLCLGPDEWLLIAAPERADELSTLFVKFNQQFTISIADISHRNIGLIISGHKAMKAINVGCPMDLSLPAFPIGKTARSVFEAAPIVLTRLDDNAFHIECWRSFAPYMRDFFMRIAHDKRA